MYSPKRNIFKKNELYMHLVGWFFHRWNFQNRGFETESSDKNYAFRNDYSKAGIYFCELYYYTHYYFGMLKNLDILKVSI